MQDVVIIGGGFAGLSAALQLGRLRRQVTVIDHAVSRHLGSDHDRKPPHELLGETILKLRPYANVRFIQAMALTINGQADAFRIATTDGETLDARRVILSHGVVDLLPDIEGLAACWGHTVTDCRYRTRQEGQGTLGLLCASAVGDHALALVRQHRGSLAVFGHNSAGLCRHANRSTIYEKAILELLHDEGNLRAAVLDGGEQVPLDHLFIEPRQVLSAGFHLELGLAMTQSQRGRLIKVDDTGATSVPGIYAAGDLASPRQTVMLAIADGSIAGSSCHASLV